MIRKKQHLWIGISSLNDSNKVLMVHPHCPLDYCKTEELDITLNNTDMQCAFEHSGILCGACRTDLSLAPGIVLNV